jgi:hypothetical protein
MEAPQKIKNRTAIQSSNITPRDMPEGMLVRLQQRHRIPMFNEALFLIVKLWKYAPDERIKKMWYLHCIYIQ